MIRALKENDIEKVCKIVNDNWKSVYSHYINKELISDKGCLDRSNRMKEDFLSGRLSNHIYEYNGEIVALLSIGASADNDKTLAFELWRIYILKEYQNKGIGSKLLKYAEKEAVRLNYNEVVIWAFKGNKNAISFYKKYGYKEDKEEYLGEPYLTYGVRLIKRLE